MKMRSQARPAFTLIELLVVIAIIMVLLGLLVPAVGKVLQRAYRTQCANQMRNIAMAVVMYEKNYEHFPQSNSGGHGWIVRVLPYMEEKAVFDQYSFNVN